jgi:hypothetical protein
MGHGRRSDALDRIQSTEGAESVTGSEQLRGRHSASLNLEESSRECMHPCKAWEGVGASFLPCAMFGVDYSQSRKNDLTHLSVGIYSFSGQQLRTRLIHAHTLITLLYSVSPLSLSVCPIIARSTGSRRGLRLRECASQRDAEARARPSGYCAVAASAVAHCGERCSRSSRQWPTQLACCRS